MSEKMEENGERKEVRGKVEEPPVFGTSSERESIPQKSDNKQKMREGEGPKGLPHQQVPQPGDFSTHRLEQL